MSSGYICFGLGDLPFALQLAHTTLLQAKASEWGTRTGTNSAGYFCVGWGDLPQQEWLTNYGAFWGIPASPCTDCI